jgi:hypothetical protein
MRCIRQQAENILTKKSNKIKSYKQNNPYISTQLR